MPYVVDLHGVDKWRSWQLGAATNYCCWSRLKNDASYRGIINSVFIINSDLLQSTASLNRVQGRRHVWKVLWSVVTHGSNKSGSWGSHMTSSGQCLKCTEKVPVLSLQSWSKYRDVKHMQWEAIQGRVLEGLPEGVRRFYTRENVLNLYANLCIF